MTTVSDRFNFLLTIAGQNGQDPKSNMLVTPIIHTARNCKPPPTVKKFSSCIRNESNLLIHDSFLIDKETETSLKIRRTVSSTAQHDADEACHVWK